MPMDYLNLFPDMTKEQYNGREDFIFAAPINRKTWLELFKERADMKTQNGAHFLSLSTISLLTDSPTVIILRESCHSDQDMIEAGAWIRMTLGFTGRIYCVPCNPGPQDTGTLLATAMGAPRELCVMFTLIVEKGDDE